VPGGGEALLQRREGRRRAAAGVLGASTSLLQSTAPRARMIAASPVSSWGSVVESGD